VCCGPGRLEGWIVAAWPHPQAASAPNWSRGNNARRTYRTRLLPPVERHKSKLGWIGCQNYVFSPPRRACPAAREGGPHGGTVTLSHCPAADRPADADADADHGVRPVIAAPAAAFTAPSIADSVKLWRHPSYGVHTHRVRLRAVGSLINYVPVIPQRVWELCFVSTADSA